MVPTRRLLRVVHAALAQEAGIRLLMRLHPVDDISEVARKEWEKRGVVFAHGPLYEWLAAARVVVTQASTVGLEALIADRPLVILNLTHQPDLIPFVSEGVAVGARSQEEVLPALRTALQRHAETREARRRFIQRYAHAVDGRSASRLADFVDDIANGR